MPRRAPPFSPLPPLAQLALIEPHVAAGDAATLNRTALAVGRKYTGKVRVRPAHRLRSLPAVAPTAPPHAFAQVRDVYESGDRLLLVTTDRLSAFDRLLACVPFKGAQRRARLCVCNSSRPRAPPPAALSAARVQAPCSTACRRGGCGARRTLCATRWCRRRTPRWPSCAAARRSASSLSCART